MLFATSQFVGHVVERVNVAFVDTVLGVLEGTGANGEDLYLARIKSERCRRGFYSDAPQSFGHDLASWTLGLDSEGTYIELDKAGAPGFGLTCVGLEGTFENNEDAEPPVIGRGTFLRLKRGTGSVTVSGGRVEHCTTLLHYDAQNGQGPEDNLDFSIEGMDFDGIRVVEGRAFLFGGAVGSGGAPTQFGLVARNCRFKLKDGALPTEADLRLTSEAASDGLRCSFSQCRLSGWRSVPSLGIRASFERCYRSDFNPSLVGAGGTALREFTEDVGAPWTRTQSLRTAWQDTPWAQTGPRANILKNSDLAGQSSGTSVACDALAWSLKNLAGTADKTFAAFGKWGQAGIGGVGDVSPGPESFGFKLTTDSSLRNVLSFVDLSLAGAKVVTYQCLCRVAGRARFRLVNSLDPATVYDEVVLAGAGSATTSPVLVTLRAQVATVSTGSPELRVENDSGADATVQVYWQQAWTGGGNSLYSVEDGLRNFAQVRTPTGEVTENTFVWGVNATSVLAAQRFRLPLKEEVFGWKAAVLAGMDLQDGEVYYDGDQQCTVFRARGEWYVLQQADEVFRLTSDSFNWIKGQPKNIVSERTGIGQVTVTLGVTDVLPGTIVRVFRIQPSTVATKAVRVTASGTSYDLATDRMAEFLFDGSTSTWLCLQFNVAVK